MSWKKQEGLSPSGYVYGNDPRSRHPFWLNEDSDTPDGTYISNLTITNENGIYTIRATYGNGTQKDIGTIETDNVDVSNLLAEVSDAIVENTVNGYDYHTITETENNGTRNNVGSFYVARNQITDIEKDASGILIRTVDQTGKMASKSIEVQGQQGPQGEPGEPGAQGEKGDTGATGPQGPAGADGVTPDITITATVDDTTGDPAVTVSKTGTDAAPSFGVHFIGLKGEKGETGATGPQGPQGEPGKDGTAQTPDITATATIDATTGTPGVTVTDVGTQDAPVFDFHFTGLKGEPGEAGETGAIGPQGPAGADGAAGTTPDISATATVDNTSGTPSVNVTKGGTLTNPTFAFAFSGLKGQDGSGGGAGVSPETVKAFGGYTLTDSRTVTDEVSDPSKWYIGIFTVTVIARLGDNSELRWYDYATMLFCPAKYISVCTLSTGFFKGHRLTANLYPFPSATSAYAGGSMDGGYITVYDAVASEAYSRIDSIISATISNGSGWTALG